MYLNRGPPIAPRSEKETGTKNLLALAAELLNRIQSDLKRSPSLARNVARMECPAVRPGRCRTAHSDETPTPNSARVTADVFEPSRLMRPPHSEMVCGESCEMTLYGR